MNTKNIGFIGAGNMAASLISGLIRSGHAADKIWVSDINEDALNHISLLKVKVAKDSHQLINAVDVVVLAVKPQHIAEVITEANETFKKSKAFIVSIAAGINQSSLSTWLGNDKAIVRCMPNTPALVETGATGLHANEYVNDEQHDLAENIMRSVGITVWVQDEDELNAVTAISGSGPAYFFLLMEAMEASAKSLGLSDDVARILIEQTALGAAKIALESGESPSELRQRVTSPNGTTEQALNTFANGDFNGLVERALKSAHDRSISLSEELGA